MYISNRMGLTVWDLSTDPYDHSQLANNFEAVDEHDHTTGKGRQIPQGGLAPDSVTQVEIATGGVNTSELADNSVTNVKMADNSVGTAELISGSVTTAKIADGSISYAKLDPAIAPIGQVILWYRATSSISVPTGWEILDGRPWASVTNKLGPSGTNWTTGNMPDMRNAFPLGAATSGTGTGPTTPPDIGAAGGSQTQALAHSHTVNAHAHWVPDHQHGIQLDGSHSHSVAGGSTLATNSHGRFDGVYTFKDTSNNNHNTSFSHTYIVGRDVAASAPIDAAGTHNHTGLTTGTGGFSSSGETPGTSSALSASTDTRPKFVGFLFLIRVQ